MIWPLTQVKGGDGASLEPTVPVRLLGAIAGMNVIPAKCWIYSLFDLDN